MGLVRKIIGKTLLSSIFILFLLGAYEYFNNAGDNTCEMTYMFEQPEYIKVELPDEIFRRHPNYSLYVYGEGRYAEKLYRNQLDGYPVLFIPGNAGSYKQVRSLASISYRKSIEEKFSVQFNYFTVDFHEEMSALYGPALYHQKEFTAAVVKYISSLYKKYVNLVLIGHSMGGMVARGIFTTENFDPTLVNTIITLATPHLAPVLITDFAMDAYYSEINEAWKLKGSSSWQHVAIISLMGGKRDVQVRPDLGMEGFLGTNSTLNLWATGVPQLFDSVDHLCIVWCKQIVMALVRAMFDMNDFRTKSLIQDVQLKLAVFNYHLNSGVLGKTYLDLKQKVYFDKGALWKEMPKRQYEYMHSKDSPSTYLMLPVYHEDPAYQLIYIRVSNYKNQNWLYTCTQTTHNHDQKICVSGKSLAGNITLLSGNMRQGVTMLDGTLLVSQGVSHVVLYLPNIGREMTVLIDIHEKSYRVSEFEVPRFSLWWSTETLIPSLTDTAYHNISLVQLDALWRALYITVMTQCPDENPGHVVFVTPWNNYKRHFPLRDEVTTFAVTLESPKPVDTSLEPELHLHLNKDCRYTLGVTLSLSTIWAQVIRYHLPGVVCVIVVFSILILHGQLKGCQKDKRIMSFQESLAIMKAYKVVLPGIFVRIFIREKYLGTYLYSLVPPNDFVLTASRNMNITLLGQMFGAVSHVMLQVVGLGFWVSILLWGKFISNTISRFVKKSIPIGDSLIDTTLSLTMSKFPLALSGALIAFSYSSCGAAGLLLGFLFYFYKCVKLFEGYFEEAVLKYPFLANDPSAKETRENLTSQLNFHFTLAFMWLLCVVLNIPTLVFWAQNISFQITISNDPSLFSAIALLISASVLWQESTPKLNLNYRPVHNILFWIGVFTLLYCFYSFYRLSYVISAVMLLLSIHHIISPVAKEMPSHNVDNADSS